MRRTVERTDSSCDQATDGPITRALVKMVNRRVPNDPLAEMMFREALKGNVAAVKEITDRVEGRVSQRSEGNQYKRPDPTSIKVIL
jgi:hypothetical protein